MPLNFAGRHCVLRRNRSLLNPAGASDRSGLRAGKAEIFLKEPFGARRRRPMFSPDGRWIAYESNESGVNEVYVQVFFGQAWQAANLKRGRYVSGVVAQRA